MVELPKLPRRGKQGWPAVETTRVSIAREIITRRIDGRTARATSGFGKA